jgi:hypothetical protein
MLRCTLRAPRHFAISLAASLALLAGAAQPAASETPAAVALTLDGMSYVLSRGDAVDLIVEARRAQISPRAGRIELAGVRARIASLPGDSPAGGLELVCESGAIDLGAREFVARGSVAGRTPSGRTLRTERLRYRHQRGLVSSDAPVSLSDESGEYLGGGFQYWVREDRFRLTGGARVVQGE